MYKNLLVKKNVTYEMSYKGRLIHKFEGNNFLSTVLKGFSLSKDYVHKERYVHFKHNYIFKILPIESYVIALNKFVKFYNCLPFSITSNFQSGVYKVLSKQGSFILYTM